MLSLDAMATPDDEIAALQQQVDLLCKLLVKAQNYASSDPEVALVQARKSVEAICQQVHMRKIGSAHGLRLEVLIQRLQEAKLLPGRLLMPLRIVQMYGNYAAHSQCDSHATDTQFALPCLLALSQVVNWYFQEFLAVSHPKALSELALVGNGWPPGRGLAQPPATSTQDDSGIQVSIDRSTIVPFPYDLFANFGELLDAVWFQLEPAPPAYTYGQTWFLKSSRGGRIGHARAFVGVAPGVYVPDLRSLREAGVLPGDHLMVASVGPGSEGKGTMPS